MDLSLLNLAQVARSLGRAVVFRAPHWDGTTDLALTHLGDTEGPLVLTPNDTYSHLTLPELTGNAKHRSYLDGEDPVIEMPMFLADPALRAIVSPTPSASGGYQRRRPVTYHTVVLFPEDLFYDTTDDEFTGVRYLAGTGWQIGEAVGGWEALSAEQTRLLGLSLWAWKVYFTKPPVTYAHAEGGKSLDTVTMQLCADATKPDGHALYTIGDPADAEIDIVPST